MKEFVYLDNATTQKVRLEAVEAMLPYFMRFAAMHLPFMILDRSVSRRLKMLQERRSESSIGTRLQTYILMQAEVSRQLGTQSGVERGLANKDKENTSSRPRSHHAIPRILALIWKTAGP